MMLIWWLLGTWLFQKHREGLYSARETIQMYSKPVNTHVLNKSSSVTCIWQKSQDGTLMASVRNTVSEESSVNFGMVSLNWQMKTISLSPSHHFSSFLHTTEVGVPNALWTPPRWSYQYTWFMTAKIILPFFPESPKDVKGKNSVQLN